MWKIKTNASLIFRKFTNRLRYNIARTSADAGLHMDRIGSRMTGDVAFTQKLSRHRSILPLYDLKPVLGDCWVAPNATVVGEVYISTGSSIWYNVVVRGEINAVRIGQNTTVGDQTVIYTAASLPTGIPASVNIGKNVIIQSNCSIYSATIDDDAFIGSKSVILQGAKVQRGAVVGPNSVVPPGRLIPSNQLWAGNPVEYVRDLDLGQLWANYTSSYISCDLADEMKDAFSLWPGNYLKKQSTKEDTQFQTPDSQTGLARNIDIQKQSNHEEL